MIQLMLLTGLTVWALIQNLVYWNYLPERVAIHFGADGQPNDWLNRDGATLLMISIQVLLPWLMVGIAQGLRATPVSMINIPHREYWLNGDRRESSLAYIRSMLVSIGILESLLIAVINHLSFIANRNGQPINMTVFTVVLGLFSVATLVLVIQMLRRFSMPKSAVA